MSFRDNLDLLILATLLCEIDVLEIRRRSESVILDYFSRDGSRAASRGGLFEILVDLGAKRGPSSDSQTIILLVF